MFKKLRIRISRILYWRNKSREYSQVFHTVGLTEVIQKRFLVERISGDKKTIFLGRRVELQEHLQGVSQELGGEYKIILYHAVLIVLIRRKLFGKKPIKAFFSLWNNHHDFLIDHLNLRWLVSAAETFCDHSPNKNDAALGLAVSILINTVKVYETERLHYGVKDHSSLYQNSVEPLFDGLTSFYIGKGDMIANLHKRIQQISQRGIVAKILAESMRRLKSHDSVYFRFLQIHRCTETLW